MSNDTVKEITPYQYAVNVMNDPTASRARRDKFCMALLRIRNAKSLTAQAAAAAAADADNDFAAIRPTPKPSYQQDIDILSKLQ